MAVSKVIVNDVTRVDLTQDTVAPEYLVTDYTAHNHMGQAIVGMATADNTFFITLSKVNDVWTPDCTFAEAETAYNGGKNLVFQTDGTDNATVLEWYYDSVDGFYYTVGIPFYENPSTGLYQWGVDYLIYNWSEWSDSITLHDTYRYYSTESGNASAADVRIDKKFYNSDGLQVGTMANGSATTPATTITANPSISVNSSGLITATTSASQSVTPTVSAGYVDTGTAGTITVSGSNTSQLTTQAAKTVTPTEEEQTAVAAGSYTTGAVKVGAISSTYVGSGITRRSANDMTVTGSIVTAPAGYYSVQAGKSVATGTAGTPTATKGTVSNHSVTVTPSVTNTTGYITGGVKTGTAVTVSVAELESGTKSITENGTGISVSGYSTVDVNVLTGINCPVFTVTSAGETIESTTLTCNMTFQECFDCIDTDGSDDTEEMGAAVLYWPSNLMGEGSDFYEGLTYRSISASAITYIAIADGVPYMEITYSRSTGITVSTPSSLDTLSVTANGTYTAPLGKVYTEVDVDVSQTTSVPLTITQNGTYTAPSGTAYTPVIVDVSGGGTTAEEKDVNFIDYDGTVVYSYTASEFANLTALPSNPGHAGLTAQGWNWNLTDAKAYVAKYGKLNVGQMYITTSGATEIDITLTAPDLHPYLGIAPNGTVVIDWGDNSTTDTVTGTSNTTLIFTGHEYATAGNYTIKLTVSSGRFTFYNTSNKKAVLSETTAFNRSNRYSNDITSIRFGTNAYIGNYAFSDCNALTSVTLPDNVTSIGTYAFQFCYALTSLTIPDGVTSIGSATFSNCCALTSLTIPDGVTSILSSAFSYCYALTFLTIPDSVISIATSAFSSCYSLSSITLPDSVTSIGSSAFTNCRTFTSLAIPNSVTSIGTYAFQHCFALTSLTIPDSVTSILSSAFSNCYALTSLTIPDGVTSIDASAFGNCYDMAEVHLLPTTPPTLANTNAFSNVPTTCIFYVPTGSLEAYQTATNWSTYASQMQEE